jgi:diguanylate cyclase (GGDEF)-like protein
VSSKISSLTHQLAVRSAQAGAFALNTFGQSLQPAAALHSGRLAPSAYRWLVLASCVLWIVLWFVARGFELRPHVGFWYPPAALSFALLLLLGRKAWLPVWLSGFLLAAGIQLWLPGYQKTEIGLYLITLLIYPLVHVAGYAVGAMLYRRHSPQPLDFSQPVAVYQLLLCALLGSALAALGGSWLNMQTEDYDLSLFLQVFLSWWSGDAIAVVTLAPLMIVLYQQFYLLQTNQPEKHFRSFDASYGCVLAGALILLILMLALRQYWLPQFPFSLIVLVAAGGLIWLAIHYHLLATVTALALYGFTGAVFAVLSKDPLLVIEFNFLLPLLSGCTLMAHALPQLRRQNRDLSEQALQDSLTRLPNRRALEQDYQGCIQQPEQSHAVIMLDIDHFKQINDNHGHAMGDLVLQRLAVLLREQQFDGTTKAYRLGGEEFVLLLPATTLSEAIRCAEQIRSKLPLLSGLPVTVTASFGVVAANQMKLGELLELADRQMYQAKSAGRNRVCG